MRAGTHGRACGGMRGESGAGEGVILLTQSAFDHKERPQRKTPITVRSDRREEMDRPITARPQVALIG